MNVLNILIVFVMAAMVGGIIYFSLSTGSKDKRKDFLKNLKDFLEGDMENIEGTDNSFRIKFRYKDKEFMYEDVQDEGFGGRTFNQGYLRVKTGTDLVMGFTERDKSTIRDNVTSFQDVHSPWKHNVGKVMLPEELERFNLHTNNPAAVARLLANDRFVNTFTRFINMDARGHPVMPLEILEGVVVLRFYSSGGFKPSWHDIMENYTAIEPYLELMTYIADVVNKVKEDLDLLK